MCAKTWKSCSTWLQWQPHAFPSSLHSETNVEMSIQEWHAQGASDSDEVASENFLAELAAAVSSRVPDVISKKAKGPKLFSIDPSIGVVVEDEGYDCRIGDRARKRRREAHNVAETRQKAGEVKGAGETSNSSGLPAGTKLCRR